MKIIKPSVEIWEQNYTLDGIYDHIARCARVCYQTEAKANERSIDFIKRTILRHEPYCDARNHLSVLEHATVYLIIKTYTPEDDRRYLNVKNFYTNNPFSKTFVDEEGPYTILYVSTNMRVIVENSRMNDLNFMTNKNPLFHFTRITVSFITNIGVSRELNRHRVHSISEESTRYCNYSKGKFDNSITFCPPVWYNIPEGNYHINDLGDIVTDTGTLKDITSNDSFYHYIKSLMSSEDEYMILIDNGQTPQQAREVLPLATKTQVVHTAWLFDWEDFVNKRYYGISGAPHPNMKMLAGDLLSQFINHGYLTEYADN